jgi:hypothetical protein
MPRPIKYFVSQVVGTDVLSFSEKSLGSEENLSEIWENSKIKIWPESTALISSGGFQNSLRRSKLPMEKGGHYGSRRL